MKREKGNKKGIKNKRAAMEISTLSVVCLLLFGGGHVSAATATLQSPSAVVYEAADENSSAVGNLVQGNTFEVKESIITESGNRWYAVSMSNGTQGYIRGEVSTDTEGANAAEEGNQEAAQEAVPAGNDGAPADEDDGVRADENGGDAAAEHDGDAPADAENTPLSDDADSADGNDEEVLPADGPPSIDNTQNKTYQLETNTARIKAQTAPEQTAPQTDNTMPQSKGNHMDKTLFLLLGTALISVIIMRYCYKKLRQTLFIAEKRSEHGKSKSEHAKSKKRRKTRRAKKKRTAKEAKKWKESSLEKK